MQKSQPGMPAVLVSPHKSDGKIRVRFGRCESLRAYGGCRTCRRKMSGALGGRRTCEHFQRLPSRTEKHRCFTEANGAFQAGQAGKRRAHYIAKVNRENFACLGKPFPKHLDAGNVIRIWHLFLAERARRTGPRFARSGNGSMNWERRTAMRCRLISDAS